MKTLTLLGVAALLLAGCSKDAPSPTATRSSGVTATVAVVVPEASATPPQAAAPSPTGPAKAAEEAIAAAMAFAQELAAASDEIAKGTADAAQAAFEKRKDDLAKRWAAMSAVSEKLEGMAPEDVAPAFRAKLIASLQKVQAEITKSAGAVCALAASHPSDAVKYEKICAALRKMMGQSGGDGGDAGDVEARTVLAQIAGAAVKHYASGAADASPKHELCKSARSPVPASLAAVTDGKKYQSAPGDWFTDKDAGFGCLKLAIAQPQLWQYDYSADDRGFVATARRKDGAEIRELSVDGRIGPTGSLDVSPTIKARSRQ